MPESPCTSPACPPERAPKPRGSNDTKSTSAGLPRGLPFFLAALRTADLRRAAAIFEASFFFATGRGRPPLLRLSRFLLFLRLAMAGVYYSPLLVFLHRCGQRSPAASVQSIDPCTLRLPVPQTRLRTAYVP